VSREELITTFSEIDGRINDLHTRSTADFLQLNEQLKDYHKKTRIISENAFRVIDTIAGKKDINLIEELGKIHSRLEDCTGQIKDENIRKIKLLKDILVKSNHLNIAIRNFRQDFTTFRFLSTNYYLVANFEDFGTEWKEKIEHWNSEIEVIQKSLSGFSSNIDKFKEQITVNIKQLETKVEKSIRSLNSLSNVIRTNIGSVIQKSNESMMQFPLLKEKTVDSTRSISNIITHLQYHDIIRQKIEHIQKAHYRIIEELEKTGAEKIKAGEKSSDELFRIGDITDLQAAQLLLVSKEFQNAIDIITKNFQGIARDITTISMISNDFSYKDSSSEVTLLKQIRNQLDEGIILLDMNDFREISREYLSATVKIKEISDQLTEEIRTPLSGITSQADANTAGKVPALVSQILILSKDLKDRDNNINEILEEILNMSDAVFTEDELDSAGSKLEQDRINLMVEITRILDSLDRDNEELDKVLIENKDLNNDILQKIENVINRVDYYDYFETMVEMVINRLVGINSKFKNSDERESVEAKARNLNEVKSNYTMASEREVHDQVVLGNTPTEKGPEDAKNEDEIEFF
jgi:hypothetical protein